MPPGLESGPPHRVGDIMKGIVGLWILLGTGIAYADMPAPTSASAAVSVVVPAPATKPAHSCAEIKAFKSKLHKLIDAALKYPQQLLERPATGVTSIAYDYLDGQVEDVHITMASGDEMLDRAALNAVKNADYGSVTRGLTGQTLHDVVIIVYDNTGQVDQVEQENRARHQQHLDHDQDCGA